MCEQSVCQIGRTNDCTADLRAFRLDIQEAFLDTLPTVWTFSIRVYYTVHINIRAAVVSRKNGGRRYIFMCKKNKALKHVLLYNNF